MKATRTSINHTAGRVSTDYTTQEQEQHAGAGIIGQLSLGIFIIFSTQAVSLEGPVVTGCGKMSNEKSPMIIDQ